MYEKDRDILSLVAMFAIGGLIGAGIALLMAPNSGPETRNMIRDKSMEMKDRAASKVEDMTSTAKDKASTLKDQTMETVEHQKDRIKDELESARRSFG